MMGNEVTQDKKERENIKNLHILYSRDGTKQAKGYS